MSIPISYKPIFDARANTVLVLSHGQVYDQVVPHENGILQYAERKWPGLMAALGERITNRYDKMEMLRETYQFGIIVVPNTFSAPSEKSACKWVGLFQVRTLRLSASRHYSNDIEVAILAHSIAKLNRYMRQHPTRTVAVGSIMDTPVYSASLVLDIMHKKIRWPRCTAHIYKP